jgi:hypothetical protein
VQYSKFLISRDRVEVTGDLAGWAMTLVKNLACTFTYQKTLFVAFLVSSHQSKLFCGFKFVSNPIFDQVMVL